MNMLPTSCTKTIVSIVCVFAKPLILVRCAMIVLKCCYTSELGLFPTDLQRRKAESKVVILLAIR